MQLAEALFLAILLAVCLFARHERGRPFRRAAIAAGLSAGLGLLVTAIVAHLVYRARPFVAHPGAVHVFLSHGRDSRFPSDHATAAAAIVVALLLRRQWIWGLVMLALALILDFGRIALGLHYPTDVLAGSSIGAGAAGVLWLPPLRSLIDRVSDFVGGAEDDAAHALLGRRRSRGARTIPGRSPSSGKGADWTIRVPVSTRSPIAGEDRQRD